MATGQSPRDQAADSGQRPGITVFESAIARRLSAEVAFGVDELAHRSNHFIESPIISSEGEPSSRHGARLVKHLHIVFWSRDPRNVVDFCWGCLVG
jgi:hypothetical protein